MQIKTQIFFEGLNKEGKNISLIGYVPKTFGERETQFILDRFESCKDEVIKNNNLLCPVIVGTLPQVVDEGGRFNEYSFEQGSYDIKSGIFVSNGFNDLITGENQSGIEGLLTHIRLPDVQDDFFQKKSIALIDLLEAIDGQELIEKYPLYEVYKLQKAKTQNEYY